MPKLAIHGVLPSTTQQQAAQSPAKCLHISEAMVGADAEGWVNYSVLPWWSWAVCPSRSRVALSIYLPSLLNFLFLGCAQTFPETLKLPARIAVALLE